MGSDAIATYSPYFLLGAAFLAFALSAASKSLCRRGSMYGLRRSAGQILPAVPMLVMIALLATTWMTSGVVPILICYGLEMLNPQWFLFTACAACAVISVLTGSSWSTIATIGVAFMGIGHAMGYSDGWIAGAIISGAYFGDKVSPLSDTTVVASSTCGVDLFTHIRSLMVTSGPAMIIALAVFAFKGFMSGDLASASESTDMIHMLSSHFNLTPWVLLVPGATLLMIALRLNSLLTLAAGAFFGLIGYYVFQSHNSEGFIGDLLVLWRGFISDSGNANYDNLVSTGGMLGMLPTIFLVLSALVFGWAMIGTGMLSTVTGVITKRLNRRGSIVGATVGSGLIANACTADQYLSLIITGNMYRSLYRRARLEPRILSRTLEDSISVTSVLIPWNSCGVTQSTVLGVATLTYLPFCVFNYTSPLLSILFAYAITHMHKFKARSKATAQ